MSNSISINQYDFFPKNAFMPKKTALPLTENEEGFLKIYSSFANAMKCLCDFKDWQNFPLECTDKESEVVRHSLATIEYLMNHPFHSIEVTQKLIDFLVSTNGFLISKWKRACFEIK